MRGERLTAESRFGSTGSAHSSATNICAVESSTSRTFPTRQCVRSTPFKTLASLRVRRILMWRLQRRASRCHFATEMPPHNCREMHETADIWFVSGCCFGTPCPERVLSLLSAPSSAGRVAMKIHSSHSPAIAPRLLNLKQAGEYLGCSY